MSLTRREFIGAIGALGLAGCANLSPAEWTMPEVNVPELPEFGREGPFSVAAVGRIGATDARSVSGAMRAMARINQDEHVAWTVALGSLSAGGGYAQLHLARETFDRLNEPWAAVPGLEDVEPGVEGPLATWEQVVGPVRWRRQTGDWSFIGLPGFSTAPDAGGVPEADLAWLTEQLADVGTRRPIGLFTHLPLAPGAPGRPANADALLALCEGYTLRVAVAAAPLEGGAVERDGVLFAGAPSLAPGAAGYRLLHFDGDAVTTERVTLGA